MTIPPQIPTVAKEEVSMADVMVVALEGMVKLDPTICELADLDYGWYAERDNIASPWRRIQR